MTLPKTWKKVTWRTHPKDIGLPLARKLKPRRNAKDKSIAPEKILQRQINSYLDLRSAPFLRIPDSAFRMIFANPSVPIWIKKEISDYIKGFPDNTVFKKSGSDILCLPIEVKIVGGKMSQSQKRWQEAIGTKQVETWDEAKKLIDEFLDEKTIVRKA
jgi:hypothetical protein